MVLLQSLFYSDGDLNPLSTAMFQLGRRFLQWHQTVPFFFMMWKQMRVMCFKPRGFTSLLSGASQFTTFNQFTCWEDLMRISYKDLSRVRVLSPVALTEHSVLLPGGRMFDMRLIDDNNVPKDLTMELVSNYAALEIILLAGQTRGKSVAVKRWIKSVRETHKIPEA